MIIETKLSCGDKGWTFTGSHVVQRTIGQIRVEYTSSPGIGDGWMEGGVITDGGTNYAPMAPSLVEKYMCVETGIGSGTIYTLGESMFVTEDECRTACADAIREEEERKESVRKWKREQALAREASLRLELASIEALKAEAA